MLDRKGRWRAAKGIEGRQLKLGSPWEVSKGCSALIDKVTGSTEAHDTRATQRLLWEVRRVEVQSNKTISTLLDLTNLLIVSIYDISSF